jgi:hypothetical protein
MYGFLCDATLLLLYLACTRQISSLQSIIYFFFSFLPTHMCGGEVFSYFQQEKYCTDILSLEDQVSGTNNFHDSSKLETSSFSTCKTTILTK